MPTLVVVGAQWGDEAKGKIVNSLAQRSDMVVRYNGGNNAGHTVIIGNERYALHLVPSGIFYPKVTSVIADGLVIDPGVLVAEIDSLKKRGVTIEGNLKISQNAHLILPYHKVLDKLEEERKEKGKIGTTGRGIGPAYADKYSRMGIRIVDLMDADEFRNKLEESLYFKNLVLKQIYGHQEFNLTEICDEYIRYGEEIRGYVSNTSLLIYQAVSEGKRVIFEGAQGTLLDIDHGTYPFVTTSHPVAGGACIGTGIGPTQIDKVMAVTKAYTTRVGEGPFPTELSDEIGESLRTKGGEVGTTTGRARRCGWLDAVALKFAVQVNGVDSLAVIKLDVLSGLKRLKVCIGYQYDDQIIDNFRPNSKMLYNCMPVYEEMEGWGEEISDIKDYSQLPINAKKYLDIISELTKTKIGIVSCS